MAMNDYSPADYQAMTGGGRNGDGLGGDNGILWLLLFIMLGGFGNRGGWGYGGGGGQGAGGVGGNELYPWLNQSEQISGGFRDQMLNGTLQGIQQGVSGLSTQLCDCCGDMQMAMANGFAGVNAGLCAGFNSAEQAASARQMASMQTQFGMQSAMQQGFNAAQAQTAQFAYDTGLGMANQTATILAEHCSDRAALANSTRDIIQSGAANTQAILDKLCALELDGVKGQLAQAQRENVGLQNQLNMATMAASQAAQTAQIMQGQAQEVDALYNRLSNCPVPSMPVYGRQPIFTCQPQSQCGCGCAA